MKVIIQNLRQGACGEEEIEGAPLIGRVVGAVCLREEVVEELIEGVERISLPRFLLGVGQSARSSPQGGMLRMSFLAFQAATTLVWCPFEWNGRGRLVH